MGYKKDEWRIASRNTNGLYHVVFAQGNNTSGTGGLSLGKRIAIGSGLVLGNIATAGLVNLGILGWLRFGGGKSSAKKKKVRHLKIVQKVRDCMETAVNKTPSHAPRPPSASAATQYLLFVLGVVSKGEDAVDDLAFLNWWNYFLDPLNFKVIKGNLTSLIKDEGLREMN